MRALVVVNPHATMTTPRARDVLLAALHDQLAVDLLLTERRGHATEAAAKARADGYDLVVAYGGDGTVNEVVNGLLFDGVAPEVPRLGIVPGGRTNVLSRNLGIANDPIEAAGQLLDAVRAGSQRTLGLGTVDDRWFAFNAGLGLDAATVAVVEQARAGGRTATHGLYVQSAFRAYFGRERRDRPGRQMTVSRPGYEPETGLDLVIVANCSPWTYLGERPVVATPQASFDTGLDLVALRRLTAVRTLRHAAQVSWSSRGPRGKDVLLEHDVADVTLSATAPVPLQVDGDYLGTVDTARFRSVPRALTVVA